MYYFYNNLYSPFSFLGPVFMIIFWVVIIYLIISLLKRRHISDGSKAVDILKERYAKGEITKEQFESMKKDLQ